MLKKPRVGWWNKKVYPTHEFHRRSVDKDVQRFIGWKELLNLALRYNTWMAERNKALFGTAFLTGGRITEVLQLCRKNFIIDESAGEVIVQGMNMVKSYEKIGEWTEYADEKPTNKLARLYKWDDERQKWWRKRYYTEKKVKVRPDFSFPIDEPFADLLKRHLKHLRPEDYLFTGYKETHLCYHRAYVIISEVGVYPHWLRAQRASCLISFYRMSMEEMMEWMCWEELSTARHYARFGVKSLVSKMKGKEYPEVKI